MVWGVNLIFISSHFFYHFFLVLLFKKPSSTRVLPLILNLKKFFILLLHLQLYDLALRKVFSFELICFLTWKWMLDYLLGASRSFSFFWVCYFGVNVIVFAVKVSEGRSRHYEIKLLINLILEKELIVIFTNGSFLWKETRSLWSQE